LHDGGVNILLKVNGNVVCESKAIYGGKDAELGGWATVSSMTTCEKLLSVKKRDILTIEAYYDMVTHPAYCFTLVN
jgi:hypothetical protein